MKMKVYFAASALLLCLACAKTEQAVGDDAIQPVNTGEQEELPAELRPGDGETTDDGRPVVMVFGAGISQDKQPIPEPEQPAKEESPSDEGEMNSEPEDTRTALSYKDATTYYNYWSDGDRVSINGVSSGALKTGDGYVGTKAARFPMAEVVPQYEDYWYYGFPADQFAFEDGVGTITIPASQNYVEGTYDPRAFIMVGKSATQTLTFYPKVSLIRITAKDATTPYDYKIAKVRLESIGGEPLSGTFTTDYDNASSTFVATSGNAYVEIMAPDAGLDFGTQFFFCVPAGIYAKGLRFIVYAKDGTSMTFSNTASFTAEVGTAHNIGSPKYSESPSTFASAPVLGEITSSTLSINWQSHATANDYAKRWRIYVSTSNDFTTGVREVEIYPKAASWNTNQTPLTFTVGRLNPGATYYVKVLDVGNNIFTPVSNITLSASPISQTMPVEDIAATGMILSENFSEIGWGSAYYNDVSYGGFYPTTSQGGTSVGGRTFDYLVADDNSTFHRGGDDLNFEFSRFDAAYAASRLNGWLYQGSTYFKNGFMKLGKTGAAGYLLTPRIPLADGKKAEVKVKVKAAKYDGTTNLDWAIAVVSGVTNSGRAVSPAFTWPSSDNVIQYRTVTVSGKTWGDYLTVEGLYVQDGDRIVFGFPKDATLSSDSDTKARVYLGYLSIEVTALTDDFIIHDETTLAAFNAAVAGGETDLNARVACNFTVGSTAAAAWTPIDGYEGTLEGNGKTITGLTKPFFGNLEGTVQNLTLNSTINQTDDAQYTAIVARQLNGTMNYCTTQGSVTFQPSTAVTGGVERYVAGMVGRVQSGSMFHCTNQASVSFPDNNEANDMTINIGGAVASMESSTASSYVSNTGTLSVGIVNATSSNCTGRIGGVVGNLSGNAVSYFTNSGSVGFTGTIHGQMYMGGIVGYTNQAVSDCENSGTVTAGGVMNSSASNHYRCVAGIVGWEDGDVALDRNTNTSTAVISNSGTSTGYTLIGGIVGYTKGTISGGSNAASVSYTGHSDGNVCVAGIVGRTVSGTSGTRIGASGVVRNSGAVSLSESSAHSNTTTVYAGGISAHQQSGDVLAQNSGSISIDGLTCTTLLVGGICGSGADNNSYSILSGSSNASTAGITLSGVSAEYRTELDQKSESYVNKGGNIYVGGLSGNAYGHVTGTNAGNISLYNTCSANGFIYVGGLCGQLLSSYSLGSGSYNVGNVSNACPTDGSCGVGSAGDIAVGGLVGNAHSSTSFSSGLYNEGTVDNSASASARVCVGGLVGKAQGVTMTSCHNDGPVNNSGIGSDGTAGVRMGGLIGFATGANNLAGTSSASNYNNAAIVETSSSDVIAVGGVVGYADNASTNLAYCQNRADGDITLGKDAADCEHTTVYVGGVLACTSASTKFNYASNAGDIVFDRLDISGQVFAGGVHGAFTSSDTQTITGCVNSGAMMTKTTDNDTHLKSSTTSTCWSFFGGISGVGVDADHLTQRLYGFGSMGKTFTACSSTGDIGIYASLRSCIGGVLAWSEICPSESVCMADIRLYKSGGVSSGSDCDSYRSLCGGVIGYCPVSTLSDLKYKGTINSRYSSPFAYTGGIVGMTDRDTEFSSCKVGGYLKAAGSGGTGYPGYFCNHYDGGTYVYKFTSCIIETGTILSFPNDDGTGKLNIRRCHGGNEGPTMSGSLPTVGSID